jgi:hypothetical protein
MTMLRDDRVPDEACRASPAWRPVFAAAAGLSALLASGCMSGTTEPGSVRSTAQTAPADLQLLCASSAASSFGVDSAGVLPVSSSQLDAQRYQVVLDVKGARANCVVDAEGNVISVAKA